MTTSSLFPFRRRVQAPEPTLVIATEAHGPLLTITADGHLVWGESLPPEDIGSAAARAFAETFDHMWIAWGTFRAVEEMSTEQLVTLQEAIRAAISVRADSN